MNDYEKLIEEGEALIRTGGDQKVARLLTKLNFTRVPRKWRLPIANLARRSSQIGIGLRLLTPVVRSHAKNDPPTSAELAEYAVLLQRAGGVREAIAILEKLDPHEIPNALLLRSFCHFNMWDYEKALPLLDAYSKQHLDPYQALVARVNRSAALVATDRWLEAENLLRETISLAIETSASRLAGNCNELLAQVYLFTDRLTEADACLKRAEAIFRTSTGIERLLVDKCRAFWNAKKAKSTAPLLSFREKALAWPHPETVRETDLFLSIIETDRERLDHLYFGTPFAAYRSRIERYVGSKPESQSYSLGKKGSRVLDLGSGGCGDQMVFPKGSVPHQVFECLVRDFYRPISTNGLFAEIFPDQFFNIFSSPGRVHQALRRTRMALDEHDLPVAVVSHKNGFSLAITGALSVEIPLARETVEPYGARLLLLREHFSTAPFTAMDARERLKLSKSAAQRFLSRARERGDLLVYGAGLATIYHFVKKVA